MTAYINIGQGTRPRLRLVQEAGILVARNTQNPSNKVLATYQHEVFGNTLGYATRAEFLKLGGLQHDID